MKLMYNDGLMMCREHYHCQHESCKHYGWHTEKGSCRPRKCTKTNFRVKCIKNPRIKME